MRRSLIPLGAALVVLAALAFTSGPSSQAASLEGVWKVVEVTSTTSEGSETNPITNPNITFFMGGYYSTLRVTGDGPRATLPDEPTDGQLVAAWRPFAANAGTYRVEGSRLTTSVMVAKSPNAMAESATGTSDIEVNGDVLLRTFTNSENGNTFRVKYERMK